MLIIYLDKPYQKVIDYAKKWGCFVMLERLAEPYLGKWYHKKRRKPLILRGARQVSKSTLVRQFAQKNHLTPMLLRRTILS